MSSTSKEDGEGETKCARCGAPVSDTTHYLAQGPEYDYCRECFNEFERVKEEGVVVRSRHGNREFNRFPYEAPRINGKDPKNQTEALAGALKKMRQNDVPGLFIYQKTGSYWLIDEYLEAHPGIAEDVEEYLESSKSLRDYLPF